MPPTVPTQSPPPQPQAYPTPEVTMQMDEQHPKVEANLASDPRICKSVAQHIYREFLYPYLIQQQRLWPIWDRIDDAWRVRGKASDLDISGVDPAVRSKSADGKGSGVIDPNDGVSAKVTPAATHKQITAKTDMHMSLAWTDGLPVRAQMPETLYEHPLYNPNQQGVDAANELLRQNARDINLKHRDRVGRGSFTKYGHAWVWVDFQFQQENVQATWLIPQEMGQAQMLHMQLQQRYGQPPQVVQGNGGNYFVILERKIKVQQTDFQPLRMDDVFIDQTLPTDDLERQPCPCVRSHITRFDMHGNDYDPSANPFGWLNVQQALADQDSHYTLSAQDEVKFRQELQKKYGGTENASQRPRNTIKQRWTCFPKLAIMPDPAQPGSFLLDEGEGVDCPTCGGKGRIPTSEGNATCPDCNGLRKLFLKPERYVVQFYGNLCQGASATVLRIQRNPTVGDKVPLLFGAHLTEDTAGAIPMSKSEAALQAQDQLATAHNQFLDSKNLILNRPVIVQRDSPAANMDLNRPNQNILVDNMNEVEPYQSPSFDNTQTLLSYIPMVDGEITQIHGMTPGLLGELAPGRRPATEMANAFDAAKMPIVVEVDSYNEQILGGWAQFAVANVEAFGDRNWIQEKTGRTTFGKLQFFTAIADEFLKRQALLQNTQYILQSSVGDPSINRAPLWQQFLGLAKFPEPEKIVNDGGLRKAQNDGMLLVTQILGAGQLTPPSPSDPHEIYVQIFQQALADPYWQERAPENLPLMAQRLQAQQQLLEIQQMQQQLASLKQMQQQLQTGQTPSGPGNKPPLPNSPAATMGQMNQQTMGTATPQ